jgi:cobalamin synthase
MEWTAWLHRACRRAERWTRRLSGSITRAARGAGRHARRGHLFEPLRLLAVAIGFLTRIPVPKTSIGPGDLRRASAFFPLVGLGVAGVGIAVRAAAEPIWGAGVATVAAVAAMIVVTGALHEDGLADTADGLWGAWDPAGRLAIMRDSRIGTYGTIAIVIAIGLRIGFLLPLGLADFARAVACGHVLGRASTLVLARLLPSPDAGAPAAAPAQVGPASTSPGEVGPASTWPGQAGPASTSPGEVGPASTSAGHSLSNESAAPAARSPEGRPVSATVGAWSTRPPESPRDSTRSSGGGPTHRSPAPRRPGLGASVIGPIGLAGVAMATVVVVATAVVATGALAVVPLVVGLAVCFGCASLFRRRLGGITGDTLGAATNLVDLAVIAAVVALARAGML